MRKFTSTKRAKIMAFAAAGLILGVGGTVTLAAWVDNEWVFGGTAGNPNGPGVGTSTFIVEQDPTSPFLAPGAWDNEPANPGNILSFGGAPLALTPGDVTYAPVALHTTTASTSGTVAPQEAVAAAGVTVNDPGNALFNALHLRVGVATAPAASNGPVCNALNMGNGTYAIIADGTGLNTNITDGQAIAAAGASNLHYCFEILLPANAPSTLQGRTTAPAWQFISTSN